MDRFADITYGTPAELVFKRIIETHKRVKTFSVFSYDLHINSDDELQAVGVRPMRRKDFRNNGLLKLSNHLHKKVSMQDSETGDAQEFGMAVSSLVKLTNGMDAHIPMLDFASRSKREAKLDLNMISNTLQPYTGFLLETGDSLHYWGKHLLTPDGWKKFLSYASDNFDEDVIDPAFIEYSLERGFSGLRIYSYGKVKKINPYVVAII